MAPKHRLRDLNMDEVSHVPDGDNPHARVLLTKSRERTETPMTNSIKDVALSPEDRKAMELAKMAAGRPELAERLRKSFDPEPEIRQHPLSKAAEESDAFAELLPYIEEEMVKNRVDHETAIGRCATNPGLYPLVEAYREEQRNLQE
jgi:hypothetical protein